MSRTIASPSAGASGSRPTPSRPAGPASSRIPRGIAALPMSCSHPPSRQRSTTSPGSPRRSAVWALSAATSSAWRSVARSLPRARDDGQRARDADGLRVARRVDGREVRHQRDAVAAVPLRVVQAPVGGIDERVQRRQVVPARTPPIDTVSRRLTPAGLDRRRAIAVRRLSARQCSSASDSMSAQQHGELLAAPARQAVLGADRALQPPGELDQHRVADQVPVGVVDLLEVVGVEQHERAAARVLGQRGLGHLAEVAPVEGAGELVGAGAQLGRVARLLELGVGLAHVGHAAQQLVLEPAPGRDVAADAVVEQRAVGVAARPQLLRDDALASVQAADPVLEVDRLAQPRRVDARAPPRPVLGVDERLVRLVLVDGGSSAPPISASRFGPR